MPAVDSVATARALYDALTQTLQSSGAEDQLNEVVDQFIELARGSGPREAVITSAVPLAQEQQTALVQQLQSKYGRSLIVNFETDPAILGGLVMRVGDRVLDESVRSRLVAVQQRMLNS
jgi:F-type H+-transporting ATPase subunit delta